MYRLTRDLHLYMGLFVSPFVLLFAASVFFLNHGKVLRPAHGPEKRFEGLRIPAGLTDARGADAIAPVRQILEQCQITGEIGFVSRLRKEQRLVVPVTRPGIETTVVIDLAARSATSSSRTMGVWETLGYLHKSPGPHNVNIRGNWVWTRAWRWAADATIYGVLFLSMTGLYLWFAIRAERRVGFVLLVSGAVSLLGIIVAILH